MIKKGIIKAYIFAEEKHKGQKRKFSDLDYFIHCKMVARRVESLTKNENLIITALLHDTIEDTDTTYEEIKKEFGKEIADLVQELTSDKDKIKEIGKKDYLRNKLNVISNEALIVKLADREHNIKFLIEDSDLSSKEAMSFLKKYYNETKYIIQDIYTDEESREVKELIRSIKNILKKMGKLLKTKEENIITKKKLETIIDIAYKIGFEDGKKITDLTEDEKYILSVFERTNKTLEDFF